MAPDNTARRPRENSSKGTLATRRGTAWSPRPSPSRAVPRGGESSRLQPRDRPDASSRRNAFTARVPIHGWRWPVGTAQRVPASVSQDRGGPHPSSHLTPPYWLRLEPPAAVGLTVRDALHQCDSVARIGGRTCVPKSVKRWLAGSGEALSPVRSRAGVGIGLLLGWSEVGRRLIPRWSMQVLVEAALSRRELRRLAASWESRASAPRAAILDTCRPRSLLTEPLTPPLSPWSD